LPEAVHEEEVRAGSRALALFVNPLNSRILRAHRDGPQRLSDVQEAIGWAAESTLRTAISNLCRVGAIEKQQVSNSPRAVATSLSGAGEEMLFVASVLEDWVDRFPGEEPIAPGSEGAKQAIKALAGGWNSTLIHEIANRPLTLNELNSAIPELNYPALERRISWMRMTGQVEQLPPERPRGAPYVVSDWLRHAVAPLAASGRCERRHMDPLEVPIPQAEVETGFLLATPLAQLPEDAQGTCMLAAQTGGLAGPTVPASDNPHMAGVTVTVEQGKVISCASDISVKPRSWAVGTLDAWLDALIDGEISQLRIGGENPQLSLAFVAGLHHALFPDR
jgi:DNA-binding HxlR family transcriptional regulator